METDIEEAQVKSYIIYDEKLFGEQEEGAREGKSFIPQKNVNSEKRKIVSLEKIKVH